MTSQANLLNYWNHKILHHQPDKNQKILNRIHQILVGPHHQNQWQPMNINHLGQSFSLWKDGTLIDRRAVIIHPIQDGMLIQVRVAPIAIKDLLITDHRAVPIRTINVHTVPLHGLDLLLHLLLNVVNARIPIRQPVLHRVHLHHVHLRRVHLIRYIHHRRRIPIFYIRKIHVVSFLKIKAMPYWEIHLHTITVTMLLYLNNSSNNLPIIHLIHSMECLRHICIHIIVNIIQRIPN